MIAENSAVPYMPRFETAKVPPSSSCCSSLRSLARCASAADSRAIADSRMPSTPRSTGVTRPPSVATAIDMSTDRYATSPSSDQVTLASGTSPNAAATAAITKSLTDTFTGRRRLVHPLAQREQVVHHALGGQVEVRHRRLGLGQPPRDRAPHRRMRNERPAGRGRRRQPPAARLRHRRTGSCSASPARCPHRARAASGRRTPRQAGGGRGPAPGAAARNRSRSRRTIRPFGPVPASPARSTPRSPASLRTSGLAKIRPPLPRRLMSVRAVRGARRGAGAGRAIAGAAAGAGRAAAPRRRAAQGRVDVGVGLARGDEDRDRVADLAGVAFAEDEPPDDAGLLGGVLDERLLGLDLGDRGADRDRVAGGDEPVRDRGLGSARPAPTASARRPPSAAQPSAQACPEPVADPFQARDDLLGRRDRRPLEHPGDRRGRLGAGAPAAPAGRASRRSGAGSRPPASRRRRCRGRPARRSAPRWSS